MTTIVTDTGFGPDTWNGGFVAMDETAANDCSAQAVDVPSDATPEELSVLHHCFDKISLIRVDFPSFSDGRGFTLAAMVRRMGYTGRLRAKGHVLADQYAMARRSGFDEVEIDESLARRQPEEQWLARADWRAHNYQARLRGTPA